jgi:hypothetical protein
VSRLQVVAIPARVHHRLKRDLETWRGQSGAEVQVRFAPSMHPNEPRVPLEQVRSNIQDGFVHLTVVPTRDWPELKRQLLFDCRVARLSLPGDLMRLTWAEFRRALDETLGFEARWSEVVRPRNTNHALLLPPSVLVPDREASGFWARCDCYADPGLLTAANNTLQLVEARHRRSEQGLGVYWIDGRRRRFTADRTAHARSPEERAGRRRFRFACEVPPGSHCDVVHELRSWFSVRDRSGVDRRLRRANVDPWGSVRGSRTP